MRSTKQAGSSEVGKSLFTEIQVLYQPLPKNVKELLTSILDTKLRINRFTLNCRLGILRLEVKGRMCDV